MENKTIEERAKKLIFEIIEDCIDFNAREVLAGHAVEYVTNTLTKQDCIARQEERERCIKAAQKLWCKNHCYDYNRCIHGLGNTRILREECMQKEEIRKAIKKGGGYFYG